MTDKRGRSTIAVLAALIALSGTGCGFRPYRAMAKAATSETNVLTQVDDKRLSASVREALLRNDPSQVLEITPYVFMGHVYLVGFVEADAQRQSVIAAVQSVGGVHTLDTYLPDKPPGGSSTTSDLETKAEVKGGLALDPNEVVTRINIEVLDGHVVLLGIVSSQQAIDSAVVTAQGVSGVTGVTNFLLVPEPEYEKLRPSLR